MRIIGIDMRIKQADILISKIQALQILIYTLNEDCDSLL